MNVFNYCSHSIEVDGVTIEPSGVVTRVTYRETITKVNISGVDIDVVNTTVSEVVDAPPLNDANIYIVSYLTSQALLKLGYRNILVVDTKDVKKGSGAMRLRQPRLDVEL